MRSRVDCVRVSTSADVRWVVGIGGRTVIVLVKVVVDRNLLQKCRGEQNGTNHKPLTGILPPLNLLSLTLNTPQ